MLSQSKAGMHSAEKTLQAAMRSGQEGARECVVSRSLHVQRRSRRVLDRRRLHGCRRHDWRPEADLAAPAWPPSWLSMRVQNSVRGREAGKYQARAECSVWCLRNGSVSSELIA